MSVVWVSLSSEAATFLKGTIGVLNERKILPPDDEQALQSAAWLEEVSAAVTRALQDGHYYVGLSQAEATLLQDEATVACSSGIEREPETWESILGKLNTILGCRGEAFADG